MCQCKKGFVGSGKYCRSGPGVFNVTYKESAYEFTEDLYDPKSSNYRDRSDGISIFFRYVYAHSPLSDVFVGAQVQAFRKGSIVIETLQVFDFDGDGQLPSADDIKRLLHPRLDLVTVQGMVIQCAHFIILDSVLYAVLGENHTVSLLELSLHAYTLSKFVHS